MISPSPHGRATSVHPSVRSHAKLDLGLIVATLILLLFGLMSLFSYNAAHPEEGYLKKQLIFLVIGIVPMVVFGFVNPRIWMRGATILYVVNLLLLVMVLAAGSSAGGAQRWIDFGPFQFQPSEMAKLLTALTLASFYAHRAGQIHKFSTFALSFLHICVPLALVFAQPHLGASLVILVIWLSISIAAGVPTLYTAGSIIAAILLLVTAFTVPGIMKDYQKQRILGMFMQDEKGRGYQTLRAKIAFGVGGLTGTGFLKGEQKQAQYIPEQHTDFIFTVIGEEGGLIGCALVLMAFAFFFYRVWLIMFRATDLFSRMVAAGIFGMLAFHTIVNLYMVLQMLPVVGLWLPFMSYGGTALLLCVSCVALLLSIRAREKPLLF